MRKIYIVVIFLIFIKFGYAIDFSSGRQGIIVFNNNEKLDGKILVTNQEDKKALISVLPQGSNRFSHIPLDCVMKIEFLYRDFEQYATGFNRKNVFAYVYLRDGSIVAMAYIDVVKIYLLTPKGDMNEYIIYDGMESVEKINYVQTVLFYPDSSPGLDLSESKKEEKKMNSIGYKQVKGRYLNFRNAPKGGLKGRLNRNTKVRILENKGKWSKVQVEGWLYNPLLKESKP